MRIMQITRAVIYFPAKALKCLRLSMAVELIIILLPSVIFGQGPMKLTVTGNYDPSVADVIAHFSGNYSKRISEVEIQTWGLTDDKLKDFGKERFGKKPDVANLRNSFFWKELYNNNSWTEVTRHLRFKEVVVIKVEAEPTIIMESIIDNNSTEPATYKIDISHVIENNITSEWTVNGKLIVTEDIEYNFDIGLLNTGGSMSITYPSAWGNKVYMKQAVNVGKVSWVETLLQPKQKVNAQIQTVQGLIRIKMVLEAYLTGDVVYQFEDGENGNSFEYVSVQDVLSEVGLEETKESSEVIDINFIGRTKINIVNRTD